jgi:hypothetical protein
MEKGKSADLKDQRYREECGEFGEEDADGRYITQEGEVDVIAMLLLKYLQLRARCGWSLSNLLALLRQQLFVYRDLQAWLDTPFEAPPALAGLHDGQLALQFQLAV